MATRERIYHRTEAGHRALQAPLPARHLRLLRSIQQWTTQAQMEASLGCVFDSTFAACLDDLEAIGLVEWVELEWLAAVFELGCYHPDALIAQAT